MDTTAQSYSARPDLPVFSGMQLTVGVLLAIWMALIILLGSDGAFLSPPGTPPAAIAVGSAVPLMIFFAAYRLSRSFRAYVLNLDLPLISGIQAWRFAGFGFLALYAHNVLPGRFALGAGLGDIAIGLTAPWVAVALYRRPRFAAGRAFLAWNALGILDLVAAVASGVGSSIATGEAGMATMLPMAQLPLVLIPTYLVPIFLMLHSASLLQARRVARDMADPV